MSQGFVADTPEAIHFFRLLSLHGRLKLEIKTGLRFSVPTAPTIRKMFGLPKGCRKQKCLDALNVEIARLQAEKEQERRMFENQRYQEACEAGKLDV